MRVGEVLMQEPIKDKEKGEIMRNAQRLISARGEGALGYAKRMAERVRETGEDDKRVFWERIAAQVELLIDEFPPDES